ncbi:MAG TPA: hypothetical protein PKG77_16250 [Phycisphaerae bacterium]|nr:hypothetical protein [Phycisphaerae bacterium]HQL75121.1 hypothetical protein [Phycisphaerae bacterium]
MADGNANQSSGSGGQAPPPPPPNTESTRDGGQTASRPAAPANVTITKGGSGGKSK